MGFFAAFFAMVIGCSASPESAFEDFVAQYNRTYANDAEKQLRFGIFKTTYEFIQEQNAKHPAQVLGVTDFADWSPQEFAAKHFGYQASPAGANLGKNVFESGEDSNQDTYSGKELPAS